MEAKIGEVLKAGQRRLEAAALGEEQPGEPDPTLKRRACLVHRLSVFSRAGLCQEGVSRSI